MAKADVTIILTVLNEIESIRQTVNALLTQTLAPKEIIIVDGGSKDGTWEYLSKMKGVKAYQVPGNRSVGRNYAVSKAKSSFIAITDAGCIPHHDWLQELTKVPGPVVSGFYEGTYENIFQKSLIPYVLVMPDAAGKVEFFPSSRSMIIKKRVFEQVGGFDDRLWHNEDFAFAHKLKSAGFNFSFAPKAIVTWIPRNNLKEAAWMFMRFAIGDIQAGILRPKVKLLFTRYLLFGFLYFVIVDFSVPLAIVYLTFGLIVYSSWAVAKNYRYVRDVRAVLWLPVLQLTADMSVIFGSVVGLLSR